MTQQKKKSRHVARYQHDVLRYETQRPDLDGKSSSISAKYTDFNDAVLEGKMTRPHSALYYSRIPRRIMLKTIPTVI
jgi:hypothetical protein